MDNLTREIPKRVLLVSMLISLILVITTYFFEWSIIRVLSGFWIGVIANLVSFRLIVVSAQKLIDKDKATGMTPISSGFFGRFGLYAISLFVVARIGGLQGLLASALGVSMVGLVIKLGSLFPNKRD